MVLPMRRITLAIAMAALLCDVCVGGVARADIADQRTTELLTALQANNFTGAEAHFDVNMRAGLPPEKLEAVWKQLTGQVGPLKSFETRERTATGGADVRIADLKFERGNLIAQVAVNSSGQVAGLFFKPGEEAALPDVQKLADEHVNQILGAIRDARFDAAEDHFDATMKSGFPPNALAHAWRQRTASLGALKAWRIVGRSDTGGIVLRIINVDFATAPKAFALKIAVDPSGDIGGFYFIEAVAEPISCAAPYIRPAAFTSRELKVGSGDDALGATLTIPIGAGPFPGAVLVHGSGPNDRNEDLLANHPFKDIAEGLSSDGIAVLRYDKRTYVHPDEKRVFTIDGEVIDDAVAAVAMLRRQSEVNRDKIFVIGHSLGAGLAPEIASRAHADGVVMLAPPGIPLPLTLVRQYRYLGVSPAQVAETERSAHLIMTKSLPPDAKFRGAPASYYYDLDSRDEVGFARKLDRPTLILHGERDYQVVEDDIEVWRKGLARRPNVTIEELPRLNHLFIAGEGKPGPDEYSIPSYVAPEVIARMAKFIKS
jgi:dienelactone hydrolase